MPNNGIFAALMLTFGAGDMFINHCATGCVAKREIPSHLSLALGQVYLKDERLDSLELYIRHDIDVAYGPFQPIYGVSLTDEMDIWAGGGLAWTVDTPVPNTSVQLHTMAGAFGHGSGIDLGGALQYRSGIELAWTATDGFRIGLGWDHRSNAGKYEDNPGMETVHLRLSLPLN